MMIGSIFLLISLLTLVSTQTFPEPDYCPYFPKSRAKHCSQMCVPFRLGEPYTTDACYKIVIQETLNYSTHVQVLVTSSNGKGGSCNLHRVTDMAVQAIDGSGYPIGQWDVGVGTAGLALFRPHCDIDDKNALPKIYIDGTAPTAADLPEVTAHKCHETPSLTDKLDTISTTFGFAKKFPTFVRFRQDMAKAKEFPGLGLLWHHNYGIRFKVTFIAEVFYFFTDTRGTTTSGIQSTIGREFYEYKPPPAGRTPKKTICFDERAAPSTIYERKSVDATVQRPIQVSRAYLDELNSSNALGAFTTTAGTTTTTTMSTTTTTTTGPSTTPPVAIPKPIRSTRAPTPPPPVIKGKNTPPSILQPPPAEAGVPPKVDDARKDIFRRCQLTKKCLASNAVGESGRTSKAAILLQQNKCIDQHSCRVMLSYGDAEQDEFEIPDNYVYVEMLGRSDSYVAVALSHDKLMGDDFVVECVRNPNTTIQIHASWNTARAQSLTADNKPNNVRLNRTYEKEKFLILHDSGYVSQGEYLFCKFSVKKELFYKDPRQNMTRFPFNVVTTLYYILMTLGGRKEDASAHLTPHSTNQIWTTGFRVAIGSRFSPTAKQQRLIHGHGQIMYFVFVFVYPNAIFIARYYKETFIKRRFFGMRDWHLVHVLLQSVGLVFIVFGHFFLTYANEGWSNPNPSKTSVTHHSWTSLATAAFYLFNLLLGFLDRERAFGDGCDLCHWLHAVLGHVIYFFGMAALITAVNVQYSDLPCHTSGLVGSWIAIYVLFHVVMSLHNCWIDWVVGVVGRAQRVGPLDLLVQPEAVEVAPGKWLRVGVLILFITVSGGFTIALITLGGVAKKGTACQTIEYFIELSKS